MSARPTSQQVKARERVERAQARYNGARDELMAAIQAESQLVMGDAALMTPLEITTIMRVVADHFRLPVELMRIADQRPHVAHPRQVAMVLCRVLTAFSYEVIGAAFGGRDHGTVIHAVQAVQNRRDTEPQAQREWVEVGAKVEAALVKLKET